MHSIGPRTLRSPLPLRPLLRTALLCQLFLALAARTAPAAAQTVAVNSPDNDRDGLLDVWERDGRGPLDPKIHDVRPGRHDFVLVVVRRPGLSAAVAAATLAKVKAFFARVPVRNPDGTTGINMVVVEGPVLPAADSVTPYRQLYNRAMPAAWRGLAHGYLLENSTNVGGQTSQSDWSAGSYGWNTVVHELGHQFGLSHAPPGSGTSPLFTSLMNYDYGWTFKGHADSIRFSPGDFAAISLNETRLNETIGEPIERLQFLTEEYGFALRALGSRATQIDWNRNGVFGEVGIAADINDGYAVDAAEGIIGGPTAGGLSMAAVGSRLYLVYPTLRSAPSEWRETTPSVRGARMSVQEFSGGTTLTPPRLLRPREIVGDPSAAGFGDRLAVGYVIGAVGKSGFPSVSLWNTSDAGLGASGSEAGDASQVVDQVALAASRAVTTDGRSIGVRERLWMFTWRQSNGLIRAVEVTLAPGSSDRPTPKIVPGTSQPIGIGASPLFSASPIAVAFDSLTNEMVLATVDKRPGQFETLTLYRLRLDEAGRWVISNYRQVSPVGGGGKVHTRPTIVLDPAQPVNGHSHITLYLRKATWADLFERTIVYREIADLTTDLGWRAKQMISEWNLTQSPPAAALFRGEHVYATRWTFDNGDGDPNRIIFHPQTGILRQSLRDFDEVGWLERDGLVRSLEQRRAR